MISLTDITLSYGARKLFDGFSMNINKRDRIGLVGSNGAGKSTLLKVLAGLEQIDSGKIDFAKYVSVGYLPQDIINSSSLPLFEEAESSFENILDIRRRISEAGDIVQNTPSDSPDYLQALETIGELELALEDMDARRLPSMIERVLHGLGFSQSDMQKPCNEFSGGWQMRIALAKLLLRRPTLLMLDEPTNHLDFESVIWLEGYLRSYDGAVIIVSHDRSFLNSLTNKTFLLTRGRIETYAGNYDFYERESVLRKERLLRAAENQERQIAKTERFIERFRYKSSKAAQVQSRIKALGKIERLTVEKDEGHIEFSFPPPERSGEIVLSLKDVCKSFGQNRVLDGVNIEIRRGDRIGVAGLNGAGKSTLARVMAGVLPPDSGEVKLGHNVKLSYFAQHQAAELDREKTVLEEASAEASMEQKPKIRNLLGSFLFSGDDQLKKVSVLSGGEKNRLALAKMLLKNFNFLILDEPTNHLDINSKRVLQSAIKAYGGTVVIVSHDRDFISPLVGKILEIKDRSAILHNCTADEYAEMLKARSAQYEAEHFSRKTSPADKPADAGARLTGKERRILVSKINERLSPLRRESEKTEAFIASAEADIAAMEEKMSNPDFYKDGKGVSELSRYNSLKAELEKAYEAWQELSERIEAIRSEMPE